MNQFVYIFGILLVLIVIIVAYYKFKRNSPPKIKKFDLNQVASALILNDGDEIFNPYQSYTNKIYSQNKKYFTGISTSNYIWGIYDSSGNFIKTISTGYMRIYFKYGALNIYDLTQSKMKVSNVPNPKLIGKSGLLLMNNNGILQLLDSDGTTEYWNSNQKLLDPV